MTKGELIYDWRKSEGSFRDKLASFVIVTVIFTILFVTVRIVYSAARIERPGSASILRFKNDDLGRFWMLQAEEEGPFPGRLKFGEDGGGLSAGGIVEWNGYRSELRPMDEGDGYSREDLAPAGTRVFPSRKKPDLVPPVVKKIRQHPILMPYDPEALAWMPEDLPDFAMPEGGGVVPGSWRFALNLGEDGTVRESISLGGGDDAGQAAMETWLRGVRFKAGAGDRWLGLRVEFVNQPDHGTEPE